jgi:hypothetical protein
MSGKRRSALPCASLLVGRRNGWRDRWRPFRGRRPLSIGGTDRP